MRAIRHAPLSHQALADYIYVCAAQVFAALQERVSWNSVRYSWSFIAAGGGPESLFPLTPEYIAAGDVWITTGTDGQIAGFVGAAPRECACSSIRRRHRPCAAPRSDEARQGHTGLEQAARRGPADDPLADPNATRFYERGADRRVALGRRCPAACSRGVTLTSGVTGSADPNINRRSGGSASSQIP